MAKWSIVCVSVALLVGAHAVFISNLDAKCITCLCVGASGCNYSVGCVEEGYCGPFYISSNYWADADKYTLPNDDPEREGAYADCANDYNCANNIVENYMLKYGKDCNGDGVTNCDDYSMIHFNGGIDCEATIEGTKYHERYSRCRHPEDEEGEGYLTK